MPIMPILSYFPDLLFEGASKIAQAFAPKLMDNCLPLRNIRVAFAADIKVVIEKYQVGLYLQMPVITRLEIACENL
jgi:hypothetical protein